MNAAHLTSACVSLAMAMLMAAAPAWADNIITPTENDAKVEKELGLEEYGALDDIQKMDDDLLVKLGLKKEDGGATGAGVGAGIAAGAIVAGSMTPSGAAAHAQSSAFTSSVSSMIGRSGDIFTFCYEGGDGGQASQGWYPVSPATGTYVITRWCTGAPCPNWVTLNAYMTLCPQAMGMGMWKGPGGAGVIGQYQSSGGSQYQGNPNIPTGLSPMPH